MTIGVALLVVCSALVHTAWNAVLKRTHEPDHAVIGVSSAAAFTSALVALALHAPAPPRASLAWCFVSGALEAGYFFTLARALSLAPLGPV
jgi:4-hydroxybenzoate polyprenyltransferase